MINGILIGVLINLFILISPQYLNAQDTPHDQYLRMVQSPESKALCQEAKNKRDVYFEIWKKLFLQQNDMKQTYFDKHISIDSYDVSCQWISGLSFRVSYRVTYDWAVIEHFDQFLVLLREQEEAYRYLPIKRNHVFNEEEINYMIDKNVFSSSISRVLTLEGLRFTDFEAALHAFQKKMGTQDVTNPQLRFSVPGKHPDDGYPYMIGRGIIDMKKNVCMKGYMNLFTGETLVHQDVCVIYN